MASGRFLSTSIADDTRLGKLSMTAEYLYLKTIPHLDRDGMISGRPGLLWGRVCPMRDDLIGEMQAATDEWVASGLVVRFYADDEPALFFPGFLKNNKLAHYGRERPSRFPAPPGFSHTKCGLVLLDEVHDQVNESVNDQLQDVVQDLIQDEVMDEVQESVQDFPLQEQEQEEEEVKDQDQEQQGDEEDTHARGPVAQAWFDHYGEEIPPNLQIRIANLVVECGVESVVYAIDASAKNDARNFRYIAQVARNYLPAATNGAVSSYHVELPGVYHLEPLEQAAPSVPAPPMPSDDPWAIALAELSPSLPGAAASFLTGSRMERGADLAGVPLYLIVVEPRAAGGVDWLNKQVSAAIRKALSSILRQRIVVEIVAAEMEPS